MFFIIVDMDQNDIFHVQWALDEMITFCIRLVLMDSDEWKMMIYVATSSVKIPLFVKRQLNVKKISTLNVKIDAICEKLTLNVKKIGSLNV